MASTLFHATSFVGLLLTGCWSQEVEVSTTPAIGPTPLVLKFEKPIVARHLEVSVCAGIGKYFDLLPGGGIRGPDGRQYRVQGKLFMADGRELLLSAQSLWSRGSKGELACVGPEGAASLKGEAFQGLEISCVPEIKVQGIYFLSAARK